MRKLSSFLLFAGMLIFLAACGSTVNESNTGLSSSSPKTSDHTSTVSAESSEANQSSSETEQETKALVVYFSWSGNTESVAKEIQTQTGADLFEIVPAVPYTDDYDALLDIAQEEKRNNVRPVIAGNVEHFEEYDIVYFGYPNWWGDMPMILYSFLDAYDFSDKTIVPFVTSGGSGFSGTINAIKRLEPNAVVADGLSLGSSQASDPGSLIEDWLSALDLSE